MREAKGTPDAPASTPFLYALCLQSSGLDSEALIEYEHVVSAGGDSAAEAAVQMALIYLTQDNLEKTQDMLTKATQLGGSSAKLYTVQGQLQVRQNNEAEAQQSFRHALQLDPNYAAAHLENGLTFIKRGVLPEGLSELERYLALVGPDNAPARSNEVELLVTQLKQTIDREGGAAPADATPKEVSKS
jgi:tetratricopeptide (TPR) repeat protein